MSSRIMMKRNPAVRRPDEEQRRRARWLRTVPAIALATVLVLAGLAMIAEQSTAADSNRSIGYWKNHYAGGERLWDNSWIHYGNIVVGTSPLDMDTLGPMFVDWATALELMSYTCPYFHFKAAFNGYVKLGGQLAAAMLNIASGADGTMVQGIIDQAMQVLAAMDSAVDWIHLTYSDQQYVLELAGALAEFNGGPE